ncbi:MFS transporter [Microvirga alba]|uniref:MFS transporter n=1 Tax=Microvirga alba TaxID=2791025 RepID=A0A931FP31_9HYPH|nr:MFS transporter [Microvirga alba]MBF9234305.1 MFS transporter [Microvirga alba]
MTSYSERTGRLIAWLLITGAGITAVARGMSLTFLALKLQQEFGLNPGGIGALLGTGPLLGAIIAPFAGSLSDLVGRKAVLLVSLVSMSFALLGLGLANSILAFGAAQIVSAIAEAVYSPVSRALMSDASPPHLRLRVFSWRYLASNAGWAIGPMIGIAIGTGASTLFVVAGGVYAAFATLVAFVVPSRIAQEETREGKHTAGLRNLGVAFRDHRLIFFLGGGTLLFAVYGQWSITLSQYVSVSFEDGVRAFAILVTTNAVAVLLASTPARYVIQKIGALPALVLGCVLFLAGEVGFGASSSVEMLVVSMIVFTLGEVLVVPSEYVLVDGIATEANRGSYFGAHSFSSVGNFLGPLLGGLALGAFGGGGMFFLFALFAAASALMFTIGHSLPPPASRAPQAQRANVDGLDSNVLSYGQAV